MQLHIMSTIRQLDGTRYHLCADRARAKNARQMIRDNRAMIECVRGDYVVDVERDRTVCADWPGPAVRKLTAAEWDAIRAAIAE